MDFTREPIVETVITPKDGCKLVVRSSKSSGQEEYFVDSVEVVAFGKALFFRSIERPKAFLVPASDYEVLEVREARMVLKNVGIERTIKIGGGREAAKPPREPAVEKPEPIEPPELVAAMAETGAGVESKAETRLDKKRDKRRHTRRRRGREGEAGWTEESPAEAGATEAPKGEGASEAKPVATFVSSLLPPPPTLISESIARYRDNAMFKGAFFVKETEANGEMGISEQARESVPEEIAEEHSEEILEALDMQNVSLEPSAYGTFDAIEEENERMAFLQEEEPVVEEQPLQAEPQTPPEPPEHLLNNPH